jgi:thiamine-phosphate pyrophosphorylase
MASTLKNPDLIIAGGRRPLERLYFITMDGAITKDGAPMSHIKQVEEACQAGIRWVQLRMKQASDVVFRETALAAKAICDTRDCVLIINDRVDLAAAIGAAGVHLGQEDIPVRKARQVLGEGKIIGGTANTLEDIRAHYLGGADYVGLGPFRYTATKEKLSPILGLEGCRRIIGGLEEEGISVPVIGIGGIGLNDVFPLLEAGLYGVAFSGMLVQAEDRPGLVRALEAEVRRV